MANEELKLTILRNSESIKTQKSLADELNCSVGKINYILKALIDKGYIKAQNFANSENKKNYKYILTPKGIQEKIALTEKFIKRKKEEYEELQRELDFMKKENPNG
ncbi:MAG: MarR family EPS-associated transcriptional regulator [Campylobacteraceae bacterium]|nr:MarR family EPS-associated transcriptional regulator [Campylobacteraceae bacterium]